MMKKNVLLAALLAVSLFAVSAYAEVDEEFVKKTENPLANMMSIPFQFNYEYGYGFDDNGAKWTLNIQPVIPIPLSDKFITLSRTIMPIISMDENATMTNESVFGLADIVESIYFGKAIGSLTFGVGPAFMLPTATDKMLGTGKWSAGPAAIGVYQSKSSGLTLAFVTYQVWSFAGPDDRADVNQIFFQPVVSKVIGDVSVAVNSEIQYYWDVSAASVPLNLTVSKVVKFGELPVKMALGARYMLENPNKYGAEWGGRFVMTFYLPE
jgi:hypothetical protein